MLLAGRIADELLLPGGWSELAGGISRGISDLPGVRVPYRGLDEWVRTVIPLGGSALVAARRAAGVLAAPRPKLGFPVAALLVLIVLYVVPVVALDFTLEFLRGAVFTLLMVAFLRLEKLRRPDSARRPRSPSWRPWSRSSPRRCSTATRRGSTTRRGRPRPRRRSRPRSPGTTAYGAAELAARRPRAAARARPQRPAYWKAENLDELRRPALAALAGSTSRRPASCRTTTSSRSSAGRRRSRSRSATCARTSSSPRATRRDVDLPRVDRCPTSDGLYAPSRTLRRGDAYTATVYTPQPTEAPAPRARAPTTRPSLATYTTIRATKLPGARGGVRADVPVLRRRGRPRSPTGRRRLSTPDDRRSGPRRR